MLQLYQQQRGKGKTCSSRKKESLITKIPIASCVTTGVARSVPHKPRAPCEQGHIQNVRYVRVST